MTPASARRTASRSEEKGNLDEATSRPDRGGWPRRGPLRGDGDGRTAGGDAGAVRSAEEAGHDDAEGRQHDQGVLLVMPRRSGADAVPEGERRGLSLWARRQVRSPYERNRLSRT